VSETYR